jgi:hypothetical protein
MKKNFTNQANFLILKGILITVLSFSSFNGFSQLFSDHFDNGSISSFLFISPSFAATESGTELHLVSNGHDEWDNLTYTINNGASATPIAMTSQTVIYVRARAVSSNSTVGTLAVTVVDNANNDVNNPTLATVNKFRLTNNYQVFELNITEWNSQWNTANEVDSNNVAKLVLAINPAWYSYPGTNNEGDPVDAPFHGDVYIDYVSIGAPLSTGLISTLDQFIKVYPNPALDKIYFNSDSHLSGLSKIKIMDPAGKIIMEESFNKLETLDISFLDKGIYILEVETSEGILIKKIVKN